MATGGRKPTPTALKLVAGNPGKRPLNRAEPKTSGALKKVPRDWSKEKKALWREVVSLVPDGVVTESDRLLIELTIINLAQVRASASVTPAQSAELRRCLAELGMNPSDRARLSIGNGASENEFSDF